MVVIPFVSDQPVNAGQIEVLGLGKKLKYSEVSSNSLKETAFSILKDEQIAGNIQKIKGAIENAPGNKGGASLIIEYYRNCMRNLS